MKAIDYTELSVVLKKWLDTVVDDVEEIIIKRKDKRNLVLVSLDKYNALKETSYLLSGKNGEALIHSIKESEEGKAEVHELLED